MELIKAWLKYFLDWILYAGASILAFFDKMEGGLALAVGAAGLALVFFIIVWRWWGGRK